jgi:hypothetical protein
MLYIFNLIIQLNKWEIAEEFVKVIYYNIKGI